MKKTKQKQSEKPATVTQIVDAMMALGRYTGKNDDAEHVAEAKRFGGEDIYRHRLINGLLGLVEGEAMLADSMGGSSNIQDAHWQAFISSGADDDDAKLLRFLRWRTLRVELPLRKIAQDPAVGPIPLAAAHAAGGLQLLLEICAEGQDPLNASPTQMTIDLKAARVALTDAVVNLDIMLKLIAQAESLFTSKR